MALADALSLGDQQDSTSTETTQQQNTDNSTNDPEDEILENCHSLFVLV